MKKILTLLSSVFILALALVLVLSVTALAGPLVPLNTINVTSGSPWGATYNSSNNKAYLSGYNGKVWVLDGTTDSLTNTINVGGNCLGIAANPNTNKIYTAQFLTANVAVINGATDTVTGNIPIGGLNPEPTGVAVNTSTNRVYVTNQNTHSMTVIDSVTDSIVTTIPGLGPCPWGVAVNPSTNEIYFTDNSGTANNLCVIDGVTNTLTHTIPLPARPYFVAVNPVNNTVYVSIVGQVAVVDGTTHTLSTTIPGVSNPYGIAVDSVNNKIMVSDYGAGNAKLIDGATNSVVGTVSTGTGAYGTAVNPATTKAYVPNGTAQSLSVLQYNNPQVTISSSASPGAGGSTTGDGTYYVGDTVNMHASVNTGYHFVNWTEGGVPQSSSPDYSFTASANRTLVANYALNQYQVVTSANPAGGGSTTGDGTYNYGDTVNVSASVNPGYHFMNWTEGGTVVSTSANYSFTATANRTLVANFGYTVTMHVTDSGGTASGGGTFVAGSTVTVHGTPLYGTHFDAWWDPDIGHVSSDADYTFTLTRDRDLYASFCYHIDAMSNNVNWGTASGEQPEYGMIATVHAMPKPGYGFLNWTEGGTVVSTSEYYSFMPSSDRTLVANFIAKPTVSTTAPTTVTDTTANPGGNVTADGGTTITARGVCYGISANPDLSGPHADSGGTTGSFTVTLNSLTPGQLYHIRAYATNSVGTSYGNDLNFTTKTLPTLSTVGPTTVTPTTANPGGDISADGGATVTARGVCYGTSPDPDINGDHVADSTGGTGTFTVTLNSLTPGQLYHIRAYATNSIGAAYGLDRTFTTAIAAPSVTTISPATSITGTGATLTGEITATGGGNAAMRGFYWQKVFGADPWHSWTENGNFGTGTFSHSITDLEPNTIYVFYATAVNAGGTGDGLTVVFTTKNYPTVTTTAPSAVTITGATSGGEVTSDGGATVLSRGVCWSTHPNPTIADAHTADGTGTGAFISSITGLTPSTRYYLRAHATNIVGTVYGSEETFTTLSDKPEVSGIEPTFGPPGCVVTLTGSNFGSGPGGSAGKGSSSYVTFNGMKATQYPQWTDTEIKVVVPVGATAGPVCVTTSKGGSNENKTFTVQLSDWYLAEGTNAWGFSTLINIENPNDETLHAKLTYMDPSAAASGKGIAGTRTVTLPPLSQTSVSSVSDIGNVDFSTKVECTEGKTIAVDRTMFWTGPGYKSSQSGYHSSIGVTSPSTTWYLPEGSSQWGFETWSLVENPNARAANITLTYMTESGPKALSKVVPPYSRATYSMQSDIGAADSSIQVTSDIPVIAERSVYRNNRREGSCSVGATTPSDDFFLAEGATGYDVGFTTYVLVQNPNSTPTDVTLTYQTGSGTVNGPSFTMAPNSRKTIRLNDQLSPNTSVSTQVHGSQPIVAERAMYWNNGTGEAFHASIGLSEPHMSFMLPDGQVSSSNETWTLVQNPNPGAVTIKVSYLPAGGGTPVTFTDEIPPGSRHTYNMADSIKSGRASILVQSQDGARPVMVERAMYMNNRGGGTDTIGGWSDATN